MSRVVVIPLSPALFAPGVIPMVAELGRRTDVSVHVLDLHQELQPVEGVVGGAAGEVKRYGPPRAGVLESVSRQLADQLGSTRVRSAMRTGEIGEALGDYAREHEAELITIGLDGRDRRTEDAAIPFARRLADRTGASVFVLASSQEGKRGTFVADLDGSEMARSRLELALTSARIAGVRDLTVQALPAGGAASGESVIAR